MMSEWLFLAASAAEPVQETSKPSPFGSPLVLIAVIFAIFWFLILRPQKKREQRRREMLVGIRKNDEVVTTGGIYGKVRDVSDDTIILEVDSRSGQTLKVTKGSISRVLSPDQAGDDTGEKG